MPEHEPYTDTGCDIAPACLACPLPACRYDLPPKRAGAMLREAQVAALLATGITADQAAMAMGCSRRTIFRLKVGITRTRTVSAIVPQPLPLLTLVRSEAEIVQTFTRRRLVGIFIICPLCGGEAWGRRIVVAGTPRPWDCADCGIVVMYSTRHGEMT